MNHKTGGGGGGGGGGGAASPGGGRERDRLRRPGRSPGHSTRVRTALLYDEHRGCGSVLQRPRSEEEGQFGADESGAAYLSNRGDRGSRRL
jgi:hypothetical protein